MKGRGGQRVRGGHALIIIFKMDKQQGPPGQHMELCSMLCGSLDEWGVWGRMDTCVFMTESLCRSPEIVTTLLVSYTPM